MRAIAREAVAAWMVSAALLVAVTAFGFAPNAASSGAAPVTRPVDVSVRGAAVALFETASPAIAIDDAAQWDERSPVQGGTVPAADRDRSTAVPGDGPAS